MSESDRNERLQIVRSKLTTIQNHNWEEIADAMGLHYRITSISHALVSLCASEHGEKTPSLWMWPSNNFLCHGCGFSGGQAEFIAGQVRALPSELLQSLGASVTQEEVESINKPIVEYREHEEHLRLMYLESEMLGYDEPF